MRLTLEDIDDVLDHIGSLDGRVIEAGSDEKRAWLTSRDPETGQNRVELAVYFKSGWISYWREWSRWHEHAIEQLVARGAKRPRGGAA